MDFGSYSWKIKDDIIFVRCCILWFLGTRVFSARFSISVSTNFLQRDCLLFKMSYIVKWQALIFVRMGFLWRITKPYNFFYECEIHKNCILEGISNIEIQFQGTELLCACGFVASLGRLMTKFKMVFPVVTLDERWYV